MNRAHVATLLAIAASYVALCGFFYFVQERMIFLPPPAGVAGRPTADVRCNVAAATLAGQVVNPGGAVDLFYLGGNAELATAHATEFAAIERARTILVDYRG